MLDRLLLPKAEDCLKYILFYFNSFVKYYRHTKAEEDCLKYILFYFNLFVNYYRHTSVT